MNINIGHPQIYDYIMESNNIVVACHVAPDGDAIGSSFALALCIKHMGKDVKVLIDEYNSRYDFIEGKDLIYKGDMDDISADLMFVLDCGAKDRLGKAVNVFDKAKMTINIDHHISNDGYAMFNFINEDASSTSEIVYEIIKNFSTLNKDIVTAIYTGIVSDTGGFKHNSTTKRTHEIVASLMDFKINCSEIYTRVLFTHSRSETNVFKAALDNIKFDGQICYTHLTKSQILDECGASYTDLDGIAEYLVNFEDVKVSAFFYEKKNGEIKVSMRSNGIDVNAVASKHNGGGHMYAAGVNFSCEMDEAKRIILEELKKEL